MLGTFAYDVGHAARRLLRDRGFSAVALLSIALGVGANTAIFTLADQVLFRLLPVREPQQLVLLNWNGTFLGSGWGSGNLMPHPLFRDLEKDNAVFEGMFARSPASVHVSMDAAAEPVNAELVSGSYFRVLGVGASLGRLIEDSDDLRIGEHPVVVISHDHWKNRLGGAADVVGRKLLVNSYPMTIVGVAAAGFHGMDKGEVPALWIPLMMKRQATPEFDWLDNRRGRFLHVFGRLKPGLTRQQAQAGLQPWFKAMLEDDTRREGFPKVTEDQRQAFLASTLEVLPASQGRSDLRRRMEGPLHVLMAATGLVLLLACLNVASLGLARALARQRETAVRSALGASRARLVREQLVQAVLLAVAGGLLSVLLAPSATRVLIAFLPGDTVVRPDVDLRVLGFTLAVSVVTGALFGLMPALRASRTPPALAMKEHSTTVAGGLRLRKALVVGQIALALVLLVTAGLFVRTLSGLRAQGPGYSTTNLLTFRVDPARSGYPLPRARVMIQDLLETVRGLPEVESAALSSATLLSGGSWNTRLTVDSGSRVPTDIVHCNAVSPHFFRTLRVPLLQGRDFAPEDEVQQAPIPDQSFRAAIVNESFVRKYLPSVDPLGARIGIGSFPDTRTETQVVGVVKTFHYRGLRDTEEQAFFPGARSGVSAALYVRTRADSRATFASIRSAVRRLDPSLPVLELRTLDDQLDRVLVTERMLATLASAFAILATVLAVIGLYGVMSFVVARRTREIGIRVALGASRRAAVALVLRDAGALIAAGLAVGLPATWALGRLVQSQLFGVQPMDGATLAGAAALVVAVALGASAVPARRASSVNPTEALRAE
jgi:predicted permease